MNRLFQTIPAKAGTHSSAVGAAEGWAPAFAGVDEESAESLPIRGGN
jgi:hypothetical protein